MLGIRLIRRTTKSVFAFIKLKRNATTIQGRLIPSSIEIPKYAVSGLETTSLMNPKINPSEIIESAISTGKVLSDIYSRFESFLHANMSTKDIDDFVYETCLSMNVYPSSLNYMGFPSSCCTSLNSVAVHGIPSASCIIKKGDLLSVDIAIYNGLVHSDSCRSYLIDDPNFTCMTSLHLMDVAKECLDAGIKVCGPGVKFKEIGIAIQKVADKHRATVLKGICGHGIGTHFHEPPVIKHFATSALSLEDEMAMEPGMMFTIEPCICFTGDNFVFGSDNWSLVSIDGQRSCQFEHTICITENGIEVLTT